MTRIAMLFCLFVHSLSVWAFEPLSFKGTFGNISAKIIDERPAGPIRVKITNSRSGTSVEGQLPNVYQSVTKLFVENGNLIVIGDTDTHDAFTAIDVRNGKTIRDEFSSLFSVSPNKKYLAHQSFFPAHLITESTVWPYICLVPLGSPDCNSIELHPQERYPTNLPEDARVKKWFARSKIAWKPDSTAFVWFAEHRYLSAPHETEQFIVTIDISDGVEHARVFVKPVDVKSVLNGAHSDESVELWTDSVKATKKGADIEFVAETTNTSTFKKTKTQTKSSISWAELLNTEPIVYQPAP